MKILLRTDGACRGNPGHSGIGAVWYDENGLIAGELYEYIGDDITNNTAEWQALELGINELVRHIEPESTELNIELDSLLVVNQTMRLWKIRNGKLQHFYDRIRPILKQFKSWKISHIVRKKNKDADALANKAIDEKLGE